MKLLSLLLGCLLPSVVCKLHVLVKPDLTELTKCSRTHFIQLVVFSEDYFLGCDMCRKQCCVCMYFKVKDLPARRGMIVLEYF